MRDFVVTKTRKKEEPGPNLLYECYLTYVLGPGLARGLARDDIAYRIGALNTKNAPAQMRAKPTA